MAAFNATSNPFVAPEWALQVNYCFFVSLSCALITALAAVVALQWVGSYDRGLNPSSVESRALQQQFRMEGAKRWKMEEIVGALPTLIFISLLLFFVGLAEWLWVYTSQRCHYCHRGSLSRGSILCLYDTRQHGLRRCPFPYSGLPLSALVVWPGAPIHYSPLPRSFASSS